MQKFNYRFLFVILVFLTGKLRAGETPWLVSMQTDRFCYVSGDVAYFKATCFQAKDSPVADQTLYADLLSSDSVFIRGYLLHLLNGKTHGYFELPDTLTTGNYQLRIYTDESKELKHPVLASQWLYVTNRFGKNQPLYATNSLFRKIADSTSTLKNTSAVQVVFDRSQYKQRSKVKMQVSLPAGFNETLWASLSIKPLSQLESQIEVLNREENNHPFVAEESHVNEKPLVFSGLKIRGQVVHSQTRQGIPNAAVLLTFEDSLLRMNYHLTDSLGNFCFYLSRNYGTARAYLNAFDHSSMKPLANVSFKLFDGFLKPVNINQDNKPVLGYQSSPDTLNLQKAMVAKAFQLSSHAFLPRAEVDTLPYAQRYLAGNYTDVVFPSDFVDLVDFAEIAKEILPYIRYRKVDGTYRFFVIDGPNHLIKEQPLVFVDGIPLVEPDKVAHLNTANIKRVDVKSQARFYGDLFFENGLVFIWTHKLDFWKQSQSDYNSMVELQLYQNPIRFHFPDYSKTAQANIPDFRQTLYWNPEVNLNGKKSQQFEFYTSDEKGVFEVLLQGITSQGDLVIVRNSFKVE
jgi:hypothetical protein